MPTRNRKPAVQSAESTTRVNRSRKSSGHVVEDAELENSRESQMLDFDPAFVLVRAGVTRSLGDFESLRVDVSITMPCHPDEVDDVFDEIAEKVSDRLADEVDEYLNDQD